ncbi:spalt major, partial [Carabus blaptoides fortunei]
SFGVDEDSDESDDNLKSKIDLLTQETSEEGIDEKSIAQRQLLKATKLQKAKIAAKKKNSLLKHMKIHEKKEGDPAILKHNCDYCKRKFPDANSLGVHIKQHTGDRPFLCNICGKF